MSLKSKKGKQTDLPTQLQSFEARLNKLKQAGQKLELQSARNQATQEMKQISQLTASISDAIDGYNGSDKSAIVQNYQSLLSQYQEISKTISESIQKYKEQEAAAEDAQQAQPTPAQQQAGLYDQAQIDQETEEIERLNRETAQILEDSKALNEIQHIVNDQIQKDSQTIIRIDETIQETHEEMVKGNEELDKAKEHQKGCRI